MPSRTCLKVSTAVGLLVMLAPGGDHPSAASDRARTVREVVFRGMCDASGAVAISGRVFAVADDEDNVLRLYDADAGGDPIASHDLSAALGVFDREKTKKIKKGKKHKKHQKKKKKKKRTKPRRARETDVEAATRLGDTGLWLTSHGRSTSGKLKPERLRFFATTASDPIRVIGRPHARLLDEILATPELAKLGVGGAALIPAKEGGLNIEGMTARPEGGVVIGFRSPLAGRKAILVVLENPLEIVHGATARFGPPVLLDLDGGGVRALSWWRGRYLILASGVEGDPSQLFSWSAAEGLHSLTSRGFEGLNPEAFFSPEDRAEILVLSDDGTRELGGKPCKRLDDRRLKQFRGRWLRLDLPPAP